MKPSAIKQTTQEHGILGHVEVYISLPAQDLSSRPCTSSFSFRHRFLKTPPSRMMLCTSDRTQQRLKASTGRPCSELRHILRPSKIQMLITLMGEALMCLAKKTPQFSRTRSTGLTCGTCRRRRRGACAGAAATAAATKIARKRRQRRRNMRSILQRILVSAAVHLRCCFCSRFVLCRN